MFLSVIIPTKDRAVYLEKVLDSLIYQRLSQTLFEIVIIDDGSTDSTKSVIDKYFNLIPIRYQYQRNSGISTAKNHGIYLSKGDVVVFMDDDDVAHEDLLLKHYEFHNCYTKHNIAMLGHTSWSQTLSQTLLMSYSTGEGGLLFSYGQIENKRILDYNYFWGGRTSCKRSFLADHGVFDPIFRFGYEDIELGLRLNKHGLRVHYRPEAKSFMIRSLSLDDYFNRWKKQGYAQALFSSLSHAKDLYLTNNAKRLESDSADILNNFESHYLRLKKLDGLLNQWQSDGIGLSKWDLELLKTNYRWLHRVATTIGITDYFNCRS